jgi:hypothetical protein
MSAQGRESEEGFEEEEDIIINLTVTGRCYARCEGCINSAITFASDAPRNSSMAHLESDPERDAAMVIRRRTISGGRKDGKGEADSG